MSYAPATTLYLNVAFVIMALSEPTAKIAPPSFKASEEVNLALVIFTSSPCISNAPPLLNERQEMNEAFRIVKLSESSPTYIDPPFLERLPVNVAL